jgi:hypothetical protein
MMPGTIEITGSAEVMTYRTAPGACPCWKAALIKQESERADHSKDVTGASLSRSGGHHHNDISETG